MTVGRAAGYPDYSSTGTSNYIPALWSPKLIEKLFDALFLSDISNTD